MELHSLDRIFATIEKEVFAELCKQAQEYTAKLLKEYDDEIVKSRDKRRYKVVGFFRTVVKTMYGEVIYERRRYNEYRNGKCIGAVYLLDQLLGICSVGKISHTLAELIAKTAIQQSFRRTAETISRMTGQTISHSGVWDVVQALGSEIDESEKVAVRRLENGDPAGKEVLPVLFEEADGVYISIQGKDRKRMRQRKQEMRVGIAYKGCKKLDDGKVQLLGKVAVAGFHSVDEFHVRREAAIAKRYDLSAVQYRILNGDGAPWIRKTYAGNVIYQLDRFHIEQYLIRCVSHGMIRSEIRRCLRQNCIDECLELVEVYRNSLSGEAYNAADELLTYLCNNQDGLVPYQARGIPLPPLPDGIEYGRLGTQENHNCTIITSRMKHNKSSWSPRGANSMAKLLTARENGDFEEVIRRYDSKRSTPIRVDVAKKPINANYIPYRVGKGVGPGIHLPILDASISEQLKTELRKLEVKIL